jgi:hypothetical protein
MEAIERQAADGSRRVPHFTIFFLPKPRAEMKRKMTKPWIHDLNIALFSTLNINLNVTLNITQNIILNITQNIILNITLNITLYINQNITLNIINLNFTLDIILNIPEYYLEFYPEY